MGEYRFNWHEVGRDTFQQWLIPTILADLPRDYAFRVFGQEPASYTIMGGPALMSTAAVYLGFVAWMVAGFVVIADRYRRAEVTK